MLDLLLVFISLLLLRILVISLIDSKNIQVLYEKGSGSFARVYKAYL